jgi:hypothetical protein
MKGHYDRLTDEDLAKRDKELREAGMFPKNPKRRAAMYRKLQEMKAKGQTPAAPKKKGPAPKKPLAKAMKTVAKAATPRKTRGQATKNLPVVDVLRDQTYKMSQQLNESRRELESVSTIIAGVSPDDSSDIGRRLSAIFEFHLQRYEEALGVLYPKEEPETEPAVLEEEPAAPQVVAPLPPPPPTGTLPLSPLPTPPPAPTNPPTIPKPPTL